MSESIKAEQSKGDRTRQHIVAKAAAVFNQHGYEGSSMQDVVEATGIEKGGIYGHFSSKEELALEAFDFAWSDTVHKRMAHVDSVRNAVDKLKLHVKNCTETPSFPGGCPWLNTAVESDDGNVALRDRARKALRHWQDALVKIIADGQDAGEIRKDADAQGIAVFLIATLEGATAVSRIDKRSAVQSSTRKYLDWFLETDVRFAPQ